MQPSVFSKIILSYPLLKSGMISQRIRRCSKNGFLILMYHRIVPSNQVNWKVQPGMYVNDTTFEMQLKFLKKHFSVIPLSQLHQVQERSGEIEGKGKPFCVLTFDDGWRDFYDHANPLLKRFNLPATVFLPTDFIGSQNLFWTDKIPFLLESIEEINENDFVDDSHLTEAISKIKHLTGAIGLKLDNTIEILKQYPLEGIEKMLDNVLTDDADCRLVPNRAFLTWDEVREMKEGGLITFGAHTCTHQILATLKDDKILLELKESKTKLIEEGVCDENVIPFCYPNGNYNKKIKQMVQETGYDMAVTTQNGWNEIGIDRFTLRRIGIHNDMTCTESMFGCKIANIL